MDKNAIKKFATWARRELIERIRQQAYRYGVENANADLYANAAHGVVLTPIQHSQRQALIERMQAKGYEATIEEVAYTWFDRFCALRFMEVNGYLPGKQRMFSDENGAFRPQILANALNIELEGLDINTVIQLKEENKTEELFKYLLLTMCNVLKPILTLFQPDDRGCHLIDRDYTWLLLPDNLLREGSVPEQMILLIPEDDWKDAVQIVGWLYQYYNAEPKDQVFANLKKNIKISKKDIPAATQLFTPDWIVRYMVENSLGRLWIEGHPNVSLKSDWKYYLEEAEQEPEVQKQLKAIREHYAQMKPEDILCIDPCMGSGHILVYMFDVLVQIYEAYGYPTREAVASIVQNNLWGLDIDDRAEQLAYFAVMMKARQYDKGWFRRGIQPHVMAIQESNGINKNHLHFLGNAMNDLERNIAVTQVEALLDEFVDAKEYGSILQPQEYDWETLRRFVYMNNSNGQLTLEEANIDATQERLIQLIEQAQALTQRYHLVVTNPPYMGASGMGEKLSQFVKEYYADTKSDMSTVCMERCISLCVNDGYMSMINIPVWMFLSSYEKLRHTIIQNNTFINMVHPGRGIFGSDFGTTIFVLRKCYIANYNGKYRRLFDKQGEVETIEEREKAFFSGKGEFVVQQNTFAMIPGAPIAYWANRVICETYQNPTLDNYADVKHGLSTGKNDIFVRLWHEVDWPHVAIGCETREKAMNSKARFFPYNKGGDYRLWYGNAEYVVWYDEAGQMAMKSLSGHRHDGRERYFQEGITWSFISTSSFGVRYTPPGFVFDVAGSSMFAEHETLLYLVGLLCSKLGQFFMSIQNPTLNFQVGNLRNVPVIFRNEYEVQKIVEKCIELEKNDWDAFETSWDFQRHPFIEIDDSYAFDNGARGVADKAWLYEEGPEVHSDVEACFSLWQKECDQRFTSLKANEEELNQIFINTYGLQKELTPEVSDKDVTIRKSDLGRDIRSFISYAVGCMFGRYTLDKSGLQFAGGDWQQWINKQGEMRYVPDKDGILPITDDEYFSDDIVTMFVDWLKKVFDPDTVEDNLKFIASALYPKGNGMARELIRQYFLNDFYKDHLKIYQKRPIYWMFDSGKKNGLKCLVYMHRWAKDTVARVRTDYVHEMQSRYRTEIEELSRRVDNASGSERVRLQKQLAKIQEQDAELLKYEEKVHHLADQMIAIDLDDGVKHNYAIFEDILAPLK